MRQGRADGDASARRGRGESRLTKRRRRPCRAPDTCRRSRSGSLRERRPSRRPAARPESGNPNEPVGRDFIDAPALIAALVRRGEARRAASAVAIAASRNANSVSSSASSSIRPAWLFRKPVAQRDSIVISPHHQLPFEWLRSALAQRQRGFGCAIDQLSALAGKLLERGVDLDGFEAPRSCCCGRAPGRPSRRTPRLDASTTDRSESETRYCSWPGAPATGRVNSSIAIRPSGDRTTTGSHLAPMHSRCPPAPRPRAAGRGRRGGRRTGHQRKRTTTSGASSNSSVGCGFIGSSCRRRSSCCRSQ